MRARGLYGPESVTWRVNRELVLLVGGGRALLLQVAHPRVAAGVAQHSNYREDPWGRLYRTLDVTTRIVFGGPEVAGKASRRLQGSHVKVQGVSAEDGARYDARDPDLLTWVWATLLDTSLLVYTRYVRPLSLSDVSRYYDEQKLFAHACGVPEGHYPATYEDFRAYWDRMVDEELRVTEAARAVADATLNPPAPLLVRPALVPLSEALGLVTVGLLPSRVREDFGFDWGPGRELLLSASTQMVRRLMPLLPSLVRQFPPARAAEQRARAA
jgi:uncharacterized protein (DUF2236 family)